jgi:hypothetical protein
LHDACNRYSALINNLQHRNFIIQHLVKSDLPEKEKMGVVQRKLVLSEIEGSGAKNSFEAEFEGA